MADIQIHHTCIAYCKPDRGEHTELVLRLPQQFINDKGINGFLGAQHESKSDVVKSPESAQHRLWSWWFI